MTNQPDADAAGNVQNERFVQELTNAQSELLGYITTLIGDVNEASNILQQTNLVLWRKWREFEPNSAFSAWARRTAYFETLAFVRDRARDRLVFSEETVKSIASCYEVEDDDARRLALRHCLGHLGESASQLLQSRYWSGESIARIASKENKTQAAIKMALMRIRESLLKCIERQMASEQ